MASNNLDGQELDVSGLRPVIRRVAEGRLDDPEIVEDVIQETLTRVLEVRGRLERRSLLTYAAITARNFIISLERRDEVERRHGHRLLELNQSETPEDHVLREEDREAVRAALATLSEADRELVMAHDVWGARTARLGHSQGMSPGAVATRLARLRAQLRLDYVLAIRHVTLPSARCRPVLLSLSSRDKRRQVSLDAAGHLLECSTCASLSEPLVSRRRALAPLLVTGTGLRQAAAKLQAHGWRAVTAGITTAAVAGGAWFAFSGQSRAPERSALMLGGEEANLQRPALPEHEGQKAKASGVRVAGVPSDEGFWIGSKPKSRIWVRLRGSGESQFDVEVGQSVDFVGKVLRNPPGLTKKMRLTPSEGARSLRRQGYHISVRRNQLELR